jgi:hypothetical protein
MYKIRFSFERRLLLFILISCFSRIVIDAFGLNGFGFFLETIVFGGLFCLEFKYFFKSSLRLSLLVVLLLLQVSLFIIDQGVSDGIQVRRLFTIVFQVFIFYQWIIARGEQQIPMIVGVIGKVLRFLGWMLILELALVMLGVNKNLHAVFPDYRLDLRSIYFNTEGLNSIFLQAQSSGIITVLIGIWFFPWMKNIKSSLPWSATAIVLWMAGITFTSILMLFIVVLVVVFTIKGSYFDIKIFKLLLFLSLIIWLPSSVGDIPVLSIRHNEQTYQYYINAFYNPISVFMEGSLFEQLFGHGWALEKLDHGDFGFGVGLYVIGGLSYVLIFIPFLIHCLLFIRVYFPKISERMPQLRVLLLPFLLMICIMFSSVHYLTILLPGIRELFALSLALTLSSRMIYKKIIRGHKV